MAGWGEGKVEGGKAAWWGGGWQNSNLTSKIIIYGVAWGRNPWRIDPPHDTPLRGGTIVKNAASQLKAEVLKVGVGAITALLEP